MNLLSAAVVDVRPLMHRERQDLLHFLRALTPEEWAMPSAAPGWSVKDLALHLLDDDLGRLSRDRDGDRSGLVEVNDHQAFVAALAAKNQRWIDGARGLSPRMIVDLLEWSGRHTETFCASLDLRVGAHVPWASDGVVPAWFDLARELTERWVHHMQMREAVGRVEGHAERYLATVLRTFVWALPHQYRVDAPRGTAVQVDLAVGGTWLLVSEGGGRWTLEEGRIEAPDARATFTGDAAWRSFVGAAVPSEAVHLQGPPALCRPLLGVRGIIA